MKFTEFFQCLSGKQDPVILLEGKRKIKEKDEELLIRLGQFLALNLPNCIFRSGNAPGADELFIRGVNQIDPSRVELVLPYSNHRGFKDYCKSVSLDQVSLAAEPDVLYHSKALIGKSIVDGYLTGLRNKNTIRAAYLIRDVLKVTGSESHGFRKADYAIFWDEPENPQKGGTGHTIRACIRTGVPWIDQKTWKMWLSPEKY